MASGMRSLSIDMKSQNILYSVFNNFKRLVLNFFFRMVQNIKVFVP